MATGMVAPMCCNFGLVRDGRFRPNLSRSEAAAGMSVPDIRSHFPALVPLEETIPPQSCDVIIAIQKLPYVRLCRRGCCLRLHALLGSSIYDEDHGTTGR